MTTTTHHYETDTGAETRHHFSLGIAGQGLYTGWYVEIEDGKIRFNLRKPEEQGGGLVMKQVTSTLDALKEAGEFEPRSVR